MNSKGKWIRLTQHLNRFPEVSSGHFPWYPECDVPFPICGNEGGWLESCSPTLWKLVRRQAVCMMRSSSEVVHLIRWLLEFKWVKKGDHLKISRWLRGVRAHHSFIHPSIGSFLHLFLVCLFMLWTCTLGFSGSPFVSPCPRGSPLFPLNLHKLQ